MGDILRGPTGFIQIKEIGELDEKGKKVFSMSGYNRIKADPKRPLASLTIPIMHSLINVVTYKDEETWKEDMATIKAYLNRLEFSKSEPEANPKKPVKKKAKTKQ
jgi:hypothetical protein